MHLPVNARAQKMFSRDIKRLSFRCKTLKFSRPNGEAPSVEWVFLRFTLFYSVDRSLSARSRNQRKISENPFTYMESQTRLPQRSGWRSINICWWITNAFTSTASAKYLTENDLAGIPEGHKRLILNMVSRLRTLVRGRPQLSSPHPPGKKTVLSISETSVGQEAQWSQREASVSRPTN